MKYEEYSNMPEEHLIARITRAKKEKNAIILAHNYQLQEVQKVADHLGDSLELSRIAAATEAANMVSPEALIKKKEENPGASVVAYVNTTASVKALVDICCTSANALNVVTSINTDKILFVPDKNLGNYINVTAGARMKLWDGYCYVHDSFIVEDVELARKSHPEAVFLVHPESPPEVIALADRALSTSGMVRYVENMKTDEEKYRGVIIGTEIGLIQQLQANHPDTNVWPLSEYAVCRNMKMTTLPRVCWSIETEKYEITLPDDVMEKARASLERMIAIG